MPNGYSIKTSKSIQISWKLAVTHLPTLEITNNHRGLNTHCPNHRTIARTLVVRLTHVDLSWLNTSCTLPRVKIIENESPCVLDGEGDATAGLVLICRLQQLVCCCSGVGQIRATTDGGFKRLQTTTCSSWVADEERLSRDGEGQWWLLLVYREEKEKRGYQEWEIWGV